MTELEQRFIHARRRAIAQDYVHLNEMQQQGVMTTEGPLLLLAGAGAAAYSSKKATSSSETGMGISSLSLPRP